MLYYICFAPVITTALFFLNPIKGPFKVSLVSLPVLYVTAIMSAESLTSVVPGFIAFIHFNYRIELRRNLNLTGYDDCVPKQVLRCVFYSFYS